MITVKEDTTIVGISEFRTHMDEILEESKKHRVLIGRRNKPVAVLINMEKFRQMETTLDLLEDFALGFLAKERESRSKDFDYLDIETVKKKLKIK